jgi:hypothetical protein
MSTLSPMTHPPQPSQAAARRRRTNTVTIVVGLAVLGVVLGLAAIGAAMSSSSDKDTQGTTAAAASESPAAALVDPNVPPTPSAEVAAAYIAALKKIDPDIVGDKDPKAIVNRGRSQCGSIKQHPDDEQRLVDLTLKRFTAPGHPDGFGQVKGKKILAVVRTHICPTY